MTLAVPLGIGALLGIVVALGMIGTIHRMTWGHWRFLDNTPRSKP